jgi:hypothetical protein
MFQPRVGMGAIAQLLKPDGFARIMVYAESARRRIGAIRNVTQLLGLTSSLAQGPFLAQRMLEHLPENHPLRLTFEMHTERHSTAGLVDAFLHACEKPFTLNELVEYIAENQCYIHEWDLSLRTQEMIKDAPGKNTFDKIRWLEATTQWPGHWTFWMSKKDTMSKPTAFVLNPAFKLRPFVQTVASGLLRQDVRIDSATRTFLTKLSKGPVSIKAATQDVSQESLSALLCARFINEVEL